MRSCGTRVYFLLDYQDERWVSCVDCGEGQDEN